MKLLDTELRIMELLWKKGDLSAKQICEALGESIGWNKNTTYTLIKRCIEKGAIERREPHFICHAVIDRRQAQDSMMDDMIEKLFDGSADAVVAALLERKKLSAEEIERLRQLIDEME